jgi:hypothetical protein
LEATTNRNKLISNMGIRIAKFLYGPQTLHQACSPFVNQKRAKTNSRASKVNKASEQAA